MLAIIEGWGWVQLHRVDADEQQRGRGLVQQVLKAVKAMGLARFPFANPWMPKMMSDLASALR